MPIRYIPDGNGGFLKTTTPGGLEVLGATLLIIGAILTIPLFVGMIGSLIIQLALYGIISLFFPSATLVVGIILFILISIAYLVIFGSIYLVFFSRMDFGSRIAWGFVIISLVVSPFATMSWAYGPALFSLGLRTEITQVTNNSPTQNFYTIKNIGKNPIYVSIDNYVCFTNTPTFIPPGWGLSDNQVFILKTGQIESFSCNRNMWRTRIISNENNKYEYVDECITIYKSENYASDGYRKICSSHNWK